MVGKLISSPRGATYYWVERHADADAPCIVFTHGIAVNHHAFDKQVPYFGRDYTVLTWDIPLHGRSRAYQDFSYAHAAEELEAILQREKLTQVILVGVGIGALIHNWIPESWVETVLGSNNPFGVILATIVGIPMYADIFGTIPVAEALLSKGAQLGTVLSFMMAVTTLSLPSLIMLRKAVKPKLLALFIGVCAIGIIIVGYLFNVFQFILM